jgi:hypothetical protein
MNARVLPDLSALAAKIAELEAANAELRAKVERKPGSLTMKITEKGAISLYGLQRFPVTLYASQWGRVIEAAGALKAFIEANKDKLATKD